MSGMLGSMAGDDDWDTAVDELAGMIAALDAEHSSGFDIDGARWVEITTVGSAFEEELDVSRENGKFRHRRRAKGADFHGPWIEGRAP